jgi:hypothetical protein
VVTAIHAFFGVADWRYRYPAAPMISIIDAWVLVSIVEWCTPPAHELDGVNTA